MIAVIFEVEVAQQDSYLDLAANLAPQLAQIEGFISIERYSSLNTPGKILSLSFWRDEAAVKTWREHSEHQAAQQQGRSGIFADYRLRVAAVLRDYGMTEREQVPQ